MKRCSKCKENKTEGEFFAHPKDGLQAQCKQCQREGKRKGNKTRKEIIAAVRPDENSKICPKCEEAKSIECFASRGGDRAGETKSWCRECCARSYEAWHRRNGGKSRKERRAEHYRYVRPDLLTRYCHGCNEYKEAGEFQLYSWSFDGLRHRCKECRSEYAREHYAHNQEKEKEKRRVYRENNRDKCRQYAVAGERRRRARMASVESTLTQEEWAGILEAYGNCCLACGTEIGLTIDHVIPISKGGTDTADNVQPLCGPCNSSKGVKTIDYRDSVGVA